MNKWKWACTISLTTGIRVVLMSDLVKRNKVTIVCKTWRVADFAMPSGEKRNVVYIIRGVDKEGGSYPLLIMLQVRVCSSTRCDGI